MKKFYQHKIWLILFFLILISSLFLVWFLKGKNNSNGQSVLTGKSVDLSQYEKFADIEENITFSKVNGSDLKFDLYLPKKTASGSGFTPIIYVHGGGWYDGDKTIVDQLGSVEHMIKSGYAVASINYRLAPANPYPAPVNDVKAAVIYLRQNGGNYNLNTKNIGLMGSSAGANLAAMAVLTSQNPQEKIQALVLIAPPVDLAASNWSKTLRDCINKYLGGQNPEVASPIDNILSADLPPTLIIQGDKDKTVPPDQAQRFKSALQEKGVKAALINVKNGAHDFGSPLLSPSAKKITENITQYFKTYLR